MQYKYTRKTIQQVSLIPLITCALGIFVLSHQPQLPQIYLFTTLEDKIQHFIAFFCLSSCIQLYLLSLEKRLKYIIILTIILGSLYGASDEFHQSFIDGRSVEVLDWVADTIGSIASLSIYILIKKIYHFIFIKD